MPSPAEIDTDGLEERIGALANLVGEIADRVRAAELATGDEKTAKELRRAMEAVAKHDPRLESRLTNRIDVLADRLGTLASAVSTTSSELARRDGELAALRRELERGSAQIQAFGQEVAGGGSAAEIDKLRKTVASLSTEHSPRKADEQVVRLGGKVDYLTERVDTLAKTVAATAAGLAGRDGDLATLRQKLDERARRLEQGILELGQRPAEAGLGRRLEDLEAEVEQSMAGMGEKQAAVEHRIAAHEVALTGSAREAARIGELGLGLAELTGRQETAERDRENDLVRVTALELDRRTSTNADVESVREAIASLLDDVERDRATVETRLDTMARDRSEQAAEIGHASRAVANQLEGLVERIERVEHLQVAGATETTRLSAEWAARIEAVTSLEAQLQSLAESVAEAARGAESEDGAGLTELDARLQAVERAGVDVAAEITRVSASWSTGLERIAAKIDDSAATALDATSRDAQTERILTELGTRLDAIVHERQTVAAQIAMASENEVAELRTLIAGFRTRLAPVDLESPGPPYVGGRLDELARRLDSIGDVGPDQELESGAGEGRLRLELRALELRAERTEKAAQQNRDAVLAQLDSARGPDRVTFPEARGRADRPLELRGSRPSRGRATSRCRGVKTA